MISIIPEKCRKQQQEWACCPRHQVLTHDETEMLQMKWWLAGKRKGKSCKFVVKLRSSAVSDCWIRLCCRRKAIKVLSPMFVTFILQIFHRKRGAYHSENSGFWFELHPAVLRFSHKMHRMYTTHVTCKHSGERCVHLKSLTHPMDPGWIPAQPFLSALHIFHCAFGGFLQVLWSTFFPHTTSTHV